MKFEPIHTERLIVREFVPADREALMGFARSPGQLRYMMFSMRDEAELDSFLGMAMAGADDPERGEYHLAVAERRAEGDRCVGSVAIMGERENRAEAELGYFFLREYWGRGYAAEASTALLSFAFRALSLHRVWGKCHVDNLGSARVMEKIGMRREGTMREHAWMGDHWRSSHLYAILDREWESLGN